jgi:hypothetical protein
MSNKEIDLSAQTSIRFRTKSNGKKYLTQTNMTEYDITGLLWIGANFLLNIEALVSLPCFLFSYTSRHETIGVPIVIQRDHTSEHDQPQATLVTSSDVPERNKDGTTRILS